MKNKSLVTATEYRTTGSLPTFLKRNNDASNNDLGENESGQPVENLLAGIGESVVKRWFSNRFKLQKQTT
jgi:hypothetical protein